MALNGWILLAPDGTVTVVSPKAELGQGIHTALAMLIAEELDVPWERLRVTHSPIDRIYNNVAAIVDGLPIPPSQEGAAATRAVRWLTAKTMREIGVMMTGGSSSVRDCWEVARQAAATARLALIDAAADKAGVTRDLCRTEQGVVICGAGPDAPRIPYGEVLREAAARRPAAITLKPPSAFTVIGTRRPRLDTAAKSRGVPLYGMDVRVPGMRYAAVAMPPALGSTIVRADVEAARARPGVQAVIPLSGSSYGDPPGMAVVADSWWRAQQALEALAISWSPSPHAGLSDGSIHEALRAAARRDEGLPFRSSGDPLDALAASARVIEAEYDAPYLAHAAMEPMNATVLVETDRVTVWAGTQVPGMARATVAAITGVDDEEVTLHQQLMGGSFGRRLDVDGIAQAAAVAKALPGVPVQLIWSREDDLRHDTYRPAAASRLRAGVDAAGRITAFVADSASQAPFKSLSRRIDLIYTKMGPDKTTAEGTFDQQYAFPAIRATHAEVELPVPVGSWRSVGHSHQGFFVESFLDEVALATQQDPLALRRSLVSHHPESVALLELLARASGWGSPTALTADGRPVARGLAMHHSFATTVALVAEVSVLNGTPRVHRVVVAANCGIVVNPDGARQQVESAVIDGLGAALRVQVPITEGRVVPTNFHQYRLPRLSDCPVIETHFLPSARVPSGLGEPVLPCVAPAVGNAIATLTGTRLRSLPLTLADGSGAAAAAVMQAATGAAS